MHHTPNQHNPTRNLRRRRPNRTSYKPKRRMHDFQQSSRLNPFRQVASFLVDCGRGAAVQVVVCGFQKNVAPAEEGGEVVA